MKVAATRGYGADIRFFDRQRDDREAFARDIAEREGLVMVPPYDDYLVMAGEGTSGLGVFEEGPDLHCLPAPGRGGGGFCGGGCGPARDNTAFSCFAGWRDADIQ